MPLLFYMPFEKLKDHQGINPRPADFDTFWDKAFQFMLGI